MKTPAPSRDAGEPRGADPSAASAPARGGRAQLRPAQPSTCPPRLQQDVSSPVIYDWSNPHPTDCGEFEQAAASPSDAGAQQPVAVLGASRVVSGLRKPFTACYDGSLKHDPCEEGSVRLELDVDCSGGVRTVVAETSTLSALTVNCMLEAASQARFAASSRRTVKVVIPIKFGRR
jgi:hypothetical protein